MFENFQLEKKYKVNPTLLTTAADGIAEQLEQDPDRQSLWKGNGVAERERCSAIAVTAAASAKKMKIVFDLLIKLITLITKKKESKTLVLCIFLLG